MSLSVCICFNCRLKSPEAAELAMFVQTIVVSYAGCVNVLLMRYARTITMGCEACQPARTLQMSRGKHSGG